MSVDGLSKPDTTNLAAPDHWHREACFRPSALRGTYGLRGPRPFARERPFSGVELCDLNFHCGSPWRALHSDPKPKVEQAGKGAKSGRSMRERLASQQLTQVALETAEV